MKVYIFGNQDLDFDNLPIRIAPQLEKIFPNIVFVLQDPNEELESEDNLIIIDTVQGIDKVSIFTDLAQFQSAPHLSLHDFDLYSKLAFMQKLGKLKKFKIIGIPQLFSETNALSEIVSLLSSSAFLP